MYLEDDVMAKPTVERLGTEKILQAQRNTLDSIHEELVELRKRLSPVIVENDQAMPGEPTPDYIHTPLNEQIMLNGELMVSIRRLLRDMSYSVNL